MQKLINLISNSKLLLPFAIFCTLLIVYLSLIDISDLPNLELRNEDKFYHILAYFALTMVWLLAISSYAFSKLKARILISAVIIAFGIIIEILQDIFTDYRNFDVFDILANSLGVVVSFICFEFLKKRFFEN